MGPLKPGDAGTIKDITSQRRLDLIFDTQTRQAQDYGYWRQGQDPDVLDAFPAQRLVRERDVKEPRDWHQQFEGEARLKSDLAYWTLVNQDFGVPWGPWGWGCGHDVEDVDRQEAEELGLLRPGEPVQPAIKHFNDRLEASVRDLDPELLQKLADDFGDQVEIVQDPTTGQQTSVRWAASKPIAPAPAPVAPPAPEPPADIGVPTLEGVLAKVGMLGQEKVTATQVLKLREELKEAKPLKASQVIRDIKGAGAGGLFSEQAITSDVQDFISYFPAEKLKALPKLSVTVKGQLASGWLGSYNMGGNVALSGSSITSEVRRTRTMFHELMHWIHREGSPEYRALIRKHFEARTKGEKSAKLPNYSSRGKKDKWYDAYAGTIYDWEAAAEGLEVPTRYIEWLVMEAKDAAKLWNKPEFRETMMLVLRALF
jgi:hypothetical protein